MIRRSPATALISLLVCIFLYAPLAVVIIYSFNTARYGVEWHGFTLDWYLKLINNDPAIAATINTIELACTSTFFSVLLGSLLAYGMSRYEFPFKRLFHHVLHVPVFIPDIVMAVSLLLFFAVLRKWLAGFDLGMTTMTLAHITFQIPFIAIVVRARMADCDPQLEEAAADLGAGPWLTFRHITLPLMVPGIVAGGLLAFTLSLDDFVVSFFTSGPGSTTLPILIYSSVKRGLTPDINAIASLIVLVSAFTVVTVAWLRGRTEVKT
ncbi:MAG: ABC transporter permease [Proteobacteria bacterium]|nr:ABC transporter permease [Pseudomonadota bacterium]